MITDPEGCASIDAASLANAQSMTLENPDQLTHGFGQVTLYTTYPDPGSSSGFEKLKPLRFTALSEAAAAAAERSEQRASVEVWLDDADGTQRQAQASEAQNSNNNEMGYITIQAILRPTTRVIRLVSKGREIERLERPQVPPTVEALVLSNRPLSIAFRVRGWSSPMRLELREDLKGEPKSMAYSNNLLYGKNSRGVYPCWLLIPDAEGAAGDQGAALRLTLFDVFHLWRFYYAR